MEGEGEAAFDWRSRIPASKRADQNPEENSDTVCSRSLFIEPVQWMAEFINQLEGKVFTHTTPFLYLTPAKFYKIFSGENC